MVTFFGYFEPNKTHLAFGTYLALEAATISHQDESNFEILWRSLMKDIGSIGKQSSLQMFAIRGLFEGMWHVPCTQIHSQIYWNCLWILAPSFYLNFYSRCRSLRETEHFRSFRSSSTVRIIVLEQIRRPANGNQHQQYSRTKNMDRVQV